MADRTDEDDMSGKPATPWRKTCEHPEPVAPAAPETKTIVDLAEGLRERLRADQIRRDWRNARRS